MKRAGFIFAIVVGVMMSIAGTLAARADETNSTNGPKLIEPVDATKLVTEKKVLVLDVRTPAEFAHGHIAGATNLDINSRDFKANLEKLDKNQPYLVHCAVGMRSAKACKIIGHEGFKTVYDLKGGLDAWKKAGLPVEK